MKNKRLIPVLPGVKLQMPDCKLVYTNGRRLLVPVRVIKAH